MSPLRRRMQWLAFHAMVALWLALAFVAAPRLATLIRESIPADSAYYDPAIHSTADADADDR